MGLWYWERDTGRGRQGSRDGDYLWGEEREGGAVLEKRLLDVVAPVEDGTRSQERLTARCPEEREDFLRNDVSEL